MAAEITDVATGMTVAEITGDGIMADAVAVIAMAVIMTGVVMTATVIAIVMAAETDADVSKGNQFVKMYVRQHAKQPAILCGKIPNRIVDATNHFHSLLFRY